MRVSAKGRYALAAMIHMAEQYPGDEYITLISISKELGISKIYLEQVFSLLKRGGLVRSVKGAQGGYQLLRQPEQITAYEILSTIEQAIFEKASPTVEEKAEEIDQVMESQVFSRMDQSVRTALEQVTLDDLVTDVKRRRADHGMMYYI